MSTSNFNPRSREGSDNTRPTSVKLAGIFQSTLPRRERPAYRTSVPPTPKFQSTLPRRERRMRAEEQNAFRDFNPRSREGSDTGEQPKARISNISIHAPAKGATSVALPLLLCYIISIHAPAKGATPADEDGSSLDTYFNPRSREGSDISATRRSVPSAYFNPRSREGSDLSRSPHTSKTIPF